MAAQVRPCSVRVECFLLGQDQHPQALIDQEGAAARVTFRGERIIWPKLPIERVAAPATVVKPCLAQDHLEPQLTQQRPERRLTRRRLIEAVQAPDLVGQAHHPLHECQPILAATRLIGGLALCNVAFLTPGRDLRRIRGMRPWV